MIDADILGRAALDRECGSISDYMLRLFAFEVLLKAAVWLNGEVPANDHEYLGHWRRLPKPVGDEIQAAARNRVAGPCGARLDRLDDLLPTYSRLFTGGRYYYELNNATVWYYPEELYGLIHALEAHVRRMLPTVRADAVAP
ncbi:MAG TPA: hypothetical protein VGR92_03570 [Steroidobacteraceae bacterium]|nr:hypothetical protein [Steroidobacteraceae bacterium]